MEILEIGFEPAWGPPEPAVRRRRSARAAMRRWLAVLTLVAAVGYGGWLGLQQYQTHVAADQALAAAQSYVLRLTDINGDNVVNVVNGDQNFADIADGSTGEFLERYTKSGAKLRQLFTDQKVSARGQVTESVVKSASKNRVVVVLLVNQSVTNKTMKEAVVDRSRVRMTMEKVGGRWLASKVELL